MNGIRNPGQRRPYTTKNDFAFLGKQDRRRMPTPFSPSPVLSLTSSFPPMMLQRQAQQTTGIDLSDPDLGVTLILPPTIAQCNHFIIFYNVSSGGGDAGLVKFTSVGNNAPFFELKPPGGEGYLDWVCDIPVGHSFTASTKGGKYSYTVGDGASDCLDVVITTSFSFASYSVPLFKSYTAHQATSTPDVIFTQTALTTEFPTDTDLSTISVPTGLFVGPTPKTPKTPHASVHGIIAAYVLVAIIVLLLPICCYNKTFFRSLYSRIFRLRQSDSATLPLSTPPSPKFMEFSTSISHTIVPGPLPVDTTLRSQFSLPQRAPPSTLAPVPPPRPGLPTTNALRTAPQHPSPLRTQTLPSSTETATSSDSSKSDPRPVIPPRSRLGNSPSSRPSATPRPRPPAASTSPVVTTSRSPDPSTSRRISAGSRDGITPQGRRRSRTRYASPDELAVIEILASMELQQRIAIVESISIPSPPDQNQQQREETATRPWSEIRLPDPTQRQTMALKILNDRGPEERQVLIDAVLRLGKKDAGAGAGTGTSAVSKSKSKSRSVDEDELAVVDILSKVSASRRSGFFAAALREEGGIRGYSRSRPIDSRGLSPDKVAIVEVMENMSVAQRRALVAAVLREWSKR